jgi:hypothetical protein
MASTRAHPLEFLRAGVIAAAALAVGAAEPPDPFHRDLAVLRQFLDRDRSYGPEARARAEAALDALEEKAPCLSPAAFQLAAAEIAALARNGHTMLVPAVWAARFSRMPLRLQRFADGLFVVHAPDGLGDLRGARVVSIDAHPVAEVERAHAGLCGALEGKCRDWIGFFAESPELLHAAGLATREDRLALGLGLPDGTRITAEVPARLDPPEGSPLALLDRSRLVAFAAENASPVPLALADPERFFRAFPLCGLDAFYVQLRKNAPAPGEDLAAFLSSVESELARARPRHAVVDLRFDGGGDLTLTRAFFQRLPGLVPGRIFALASGRTFSAGISSLGYLKQAGGDRVTIVGEPVGDGLSFWAEGALLELPDSGGVLLYATERHDYRTGCPEADCHDAIRRHPIRVASLEPDVLAPLAFADYRAGRDPAMEAVAASLGEGVPSVPGRP